MKRFAVLLTLAVLMALPAAAQNMNVGVQIGSGTSLEGDFDLDFDDSVREIYFATQFEQGSLFKVKVGQFDTVEFGEDGSVEYVDALVEYKFSEVFGSTGLFAGPGFYRAKRDHLGDLPDEDSDYGFSAGVNGHFPMTRHLGFTLEAAYHWAKLDSDFEPDASGALVAGEDRFSFVNVTGGLRFSF